MFSKIVSLTILICVIIANQARANNISTIYTTCDLDLNPEALVYLSKECQTLTESEKVLYEMERESYTDFKEQYDKILKNLAENGDEDEAEAIFQELFSIYDNAQLFDCRYEESFQDYVNCMVDLRNVMIDDIKLML